MRLVLKRRIYGKEKNSLVINRLVDAIINLMLQELYSTNSNNLAASTLLFNSFYYTSEYLLKK